MSFYILRCWGFIDFELSLFAIPLKCVARCEMLTNLHLQLLISHYLHKNHIQPFLCFVLAERKLVQLYALSYVARFVTTASH